MIILSIELWENIRYIKNIFLLFYFELRKHGKLLIKGLSQLTNDLLADNFIVIYISLVNQSLMKKQQLLGI